MVKPISDNAQLQIDNKDIKPLYLFEINGTDYTEYLISYNISMDKSFGSASATFVLLNDLGEFGDSGNAKIFVGDIIEFSCGYEGDETLYKKFYGLVDQRPIEKSYDKKTITLNCLDYISTLLYLDIDVKYEANKIKIENDILEPIYLSDDPNSDLYDLAQLFNFHRTSIATNPPPIITIRNLDNYTEDPQFDGFECFSSDTEVLTENGWMFLKEIVDNKLLIKIATLNSDKNIVEYFYPEKFIKYFVKDKMFNLTGKRIDLLVTKNHLLWAKRSHRRDYEFFLSVNCPRYIYYKKDFPCLDVSDKEFFVLPSYEITYKNGNYTDSLNRKCPEYLLTRKFKERIIKMDDWLRFFGIWITEGNLSKNYKLNKYNNIHITQNPGKKTEKIKQWLNSLNIKYEYKIRKRGKYIGGEFRFCDILMVQYLLQFGKSKDKYIPREFLNLSKRQLNILLDALMMGDGTYDKPKNKYYCTASLQLANNVLEIILKLGYTSTIRLVKKDKFLTYYVTICERKETFPNHIVDKRNFIDYNDYVYCLEVPNHLLYVRRNGKSCWCGNCYYQTGQLKLGYSLNARYNHEVLAKSYYMYTRGLYIEDIIENILTLPDEYGKYIFGEETVLDVIDNHLTETFYNLEGNSSEDYLTPNTTSSTISIYTEVEEDHIPTLTGYNNTLTVTSTEGLPDSGEAEINGDIFTWTSKDDTHLYGISGLNEHLLYTNDDEEIIKPVLKYEETYAIGLVWYLSYSNLITDLDSSDFLIPSNYSILYIDKRFGRIILSDAISITSTVKCLVDYTFKTLLATGIELNEISFRSRDIENRFEAIKLLYDYCVDKDTECLTKNGWKKYNELKIGEEIYTLNPLTEIAEWKPLKKITHYNYKGKIVKHTNLSFDSLSIPLHKWITKSTRDLKYTSKLKFRTSETLHSSDNIIRSAKLENNNSKIISNQLVQLIGWIVTEGYYHNYKNKKIDTIVISQSIKANLKKVIEIEYLLKLLNIKYSINVNKDNILRFFIYDQNIINIILQLIPDKKLNFKLINKLDLELISILIETLLKGDGNCQKRKHVTSKRYYTTDIENAEGFLYLLILNGQHGTITKEKLTLRKGSIVKKVPEKGFKDIYIVRVNNARYSSVKYLKKEEIDYNDIVWCPFTDNLTFLMRKNGKVCFTGNCAPNFLIRTVGDDKIWASYLYLKTLPDYNLDLITSILYMEDEDIYTRVLFYAKNKEPHNIVMESGVEFITTGDEYLAFADLTELTYEKTEGDFYVYKCGINNAGKIVLELNTIDGTERIEPEVYINNVKVDSNPYRMASLPVVKEITTRTETITVTKKSGKNTRTETYVNTYYYYQIKFPHSSLMPTLEIILYDANATEVMRIPANSSYMAYDKGIYYVPGSSRNSVIESISTGTYWVQYYTGSLVIDYDNVRFKIRNTIIKDANLDLVKANFQYLTALTSVIGIDNVIDGRWDTQTQTEFYAEPPTGYNYAILDLGSVKGIQAMDLVAGFFKPDSFRKYDIDMRLTIHYSLDNVSYYPISDKTTNFTLTGGLHLSLEEEDLGLGFLARYLKLILENIKKIEYGNGVWCVALTELALYSDIIIKGESKLIPYTLTTDEVIIPPESPIAQYNLNDNLATTVVIDSISGNNGVASSNTNLLSLSGKIDKCFYFDGDDKIQVNNFTAINNLNDNFSFSFHLKAGLLSGNNHGLLVKRSSGAFFAITLEKVSTVNKIKIRLNDGTHNILPLYTLPSITDWLHIVITINGKTANSLKVYCNNVELTTTDTKSLSGFSTLANTNNLFIGQDNINNSYLNGYLDNIRIYDYTLSEDEINYLYNNGSGIETDVIFMNVEDTTAFSSSGTAYIEGDEFTYTSKTLTSFIGVSGLTLDYSNASAVTQTLENGINVYDKLGLLVKLSDRVYKEIKVEDEYLYDQSLIDRIAKAYLEEFVKNHLKIQVLVLYAPYLKIGDTVRLIDTTYNGIDQNYFIESINLTENGLFSLVLARYEE